MGQDISISVDVKFASTKRCISFYVGMSSSALTTGGGRATVEFLLELFTDVVSVRYPEEVFMFYAESDADYEHYYKDWAQIQNGNVTNEKSYILYASDGWSEREPRGDGTIPDWFVNHTKGLLFHSIVCMRNRIQREDKTIEFFGDFNKEDNDLFLEIAERVDLCSSFDYIQYDVENMYCVSNGDNVLISSLSEQHQEHYFECKPDITNRTSILFELFHPELLVIYGDMNTAKMAYDKGEFALYETAEGMKFYSFWRNKGWSYRKAMLIALGYTPIAGEEVSVNPLYVDAQQKFSVDAMKYWISNTSYYFGADYDVEVSETHFTYKIVIKDEKLTEVRFRLSDFYPI